MICDIRVVYLLIFITFLTNLSNQDLKNMQKNNPGINPGLYYELATSYKYVENTHTSLPLIFNLAELVGISISLTV